jgi:hypothetical protein
LGTAVGAILGTVVGAPKADEAVKAGDKAAMGEAEAVVQQAEQREEARRRGAVQHWEEQTLSRIQQNWARVC